MEWLGVIVDHCLFICRDVEFNRLAIQFQKHANWTTTMQVPFQHTLWVLHYFILTLVNLLVCDVQELEAIVREV